MPKPVKKPRKPRTFNTDALSPNQAARILNVTSPAVKRWIYLGRLPATKLPNGYWRIKHDDLTAYLDRRRNATQVLSLASMNQTLKAPLATSANDLDCAFTTVTNTKGGPAAPAKEKKRKHPWHECPSGHVSVKEAAKLAGMSKITLTEWIRKGWLPVKRTYSGRRIWIKEEEIVQVLKLKSRSRRVPDTTTVSFKDAQAKRQPACAGPTPDAV